MYVYDCFSLVLNLCLRMNKWTTHLFNEWKPHMHTKACTMLCAPEPPPTLVMDIVLLCYVPVIQGDFPSGALTWPINTQLYNEKSSSNRSFQHTWVSTAATSLVAKLCYSHFYTDTIEVSYSSLYTMIPIYVPRASDVVVFRYAHIAIASVSPMLPLCGQTTQTQLIGLVMGCPYFNWNWSRCAEITPSSSTYRLCVPIFAVGRQNIGLTQS